VTADARTKGGRLHPPEAESERADGAAADRPPNDPARLAVDVFLICGQFPGAGAGDALRNAVRYGRAAEAAGFDSAWIAEHHFMTYGVCPSGMALAAHLLGATTRLTVGTAAAILSSRHPVALAEEAVMLDQLSDGRFHLGVARGSPLVDLEVFGTGLARYQTALPESLDLLQRWLSGAPKVKADGEHFRFRPVSVVPRPTRRVPVYVAATSPDTVAAAAARGLPLLLGMHATAAENRDAIAYHGEQAIAHGHDPTHLVHATAHLAYVADSATQARADLQDTLPLWVDTRTSHVRIDGGTGPARDPRAYAEQLMRIHAVGTPEHCVQQLTESAGTSGARRLMLVVEAAGDVGRTLRNIARLGEEVIPYVRRQRQPATDPGPTLGGQVPVNIRPPPSGLSHPTRVRC
jgi:alkanesulfonate monooxygenase SsuD/methylene tetrahydromethanopterin reductase-like flavin-dependent oxidoreductase (luciferase family)